MHDFIHPKLPQEEWRETKHKEQRLPQPGFIINMCPANGSPQISVSGEIFQPKINDNINGLSRKNQSLIFQILTGHAESVATFLFVCSQTHAICTI